MIDASEFIKTYERFYFQKGDKKDDKLKLGIKGIRTTSEEDEKCIVGMLQEGIHDQYVIAWKLGSFHAKDIISPKSIVGYRRYDMSRYLDAIQKRSKDITDAIDEALGCFNGESSQLSAVKKLSDAFDIIKECNDVKGFGTVYMINTMFFLSKGKIPIYDKNVFKAVQALYLKKNPKDITVSGAPEAKDSIGAMFRLLEYMFLLNHIFGEGKKSKSVEYSALEHVGFISRGLDRALWVYGQCTEKYKEDSSKSVI